MHQNYINIVARITCWKILYVGLKNYSRYPSYVNNPKTAIQRLYYILITFFWLTCFGR